MRWMKKGSPKAKPESRSRRWIRRGAWAALGVAILGAAIWFAVCFRRVWTQAGRDETRVADCIVVFGAAEYHGKPSPILRRRLERALELYAAHMAPMVITTGGPEWDPNYTEGGVARDYLVDQGVSEQAVIAEMSAANTAESARRVAKIMRANGYRNCLAVSDPEHMYRIKQLMAEQGVETYASPRSAPIDEGYVGREALAYMAWRSGLAKLWGRKLSLTRRLGGL